MTSSESLDGSEPYSLLDLYPGIVFICQSVNVLIFIFIYPSIHEVLICCYVDLNVRLNADIFTPGLHNADSADEIIKDRKRVVHLSLFLTSYVIPRFVSYNTSIIVHVHVYVYVHVHVHVYVHVHMFTYVFVCVCVCNYILLYIIYGCV